MRQVVSGLFVGKETESHQIWSSKGSLIHQIVVQEGKHDVKPEMEKDIVVSIVPM